MKDFLATPRLQPTSPGSKYRYKLTYPNGYTKYVRYPENLPKEVSNPNEKERMENRMQTQKVAKSLLKLARELIAFDFPTKDALDEYLKEHPGADKSLHKVVENKSQSKKQNQDQQSSPQKENKPETNAKPSSSVEKPKSFFSEEEHALPDVALQPVNDKEGVYKQAQEAMGQMLDWLDRGKGVDKTLGAKHYEGMPTDEELDEKGPVLITAPLKGEKRATEKVKSDYDGNWNQLTDIVRASIAVDHVSDIHGVLGALRKSGMQLARKPKDRFAKPTEAGYRDILMNVKYPNGHVGELQVHVKPMIKAKSIAHKDYEVVRTIEGKAKAENRTALSEQEMNTVMEANKKMQATYGAAWESASAKTASSRSFVAGNTIYYVFDDFPAKWEYKKFPVVIKRGNETVMYDLEKFFTGVNVIDKKEFDAMVQAQKSKKSSSIKIASEILAVAEEIVKG